MSLHPAPSPEDIDGRLSILPQFAAPGEVSEVPRHQLPGEGVEHQLVVHDLVCGVRRQASSRWGRTRPA